MCFDFAFFYVAFLLPFPFPRVAPFDPFSPGLMNSRFYSSLKCVLILLNMSPPPSLFPTLPNALRRDEKLRLLCLFELSLKGVKLIVNVYYVRSLPSSLIRHKWQWTIQFIITCQNREHSSQAHFRDLSILFPHVQCLCTFEENLIVSRIYVARWSIAL